MRDHTAATACRHSLAASARKIRSVDLDPLDQGAQHIELIRGGSAAAMTHIRDRVKPGELCGSSQPAVLSGEFV
jgi:hypothetical protein